MLNHIKKNVFWFSSFALPIILLGSISGCGPKKVEYKNRKEHFKESIYGVKASPKILKKGRLSHRKGRYHIGKPYQVKGKWYYPSENFAYTKAGSASWYGSAFHGRLTANGEVFDMHKLTAAHATLPLPSYVKVTNLQNNQSLIVRVNDRGPYARNHIIDLSKRAAQMLGYLHQGIAKVRLEYLEKAPLHAQDHDYLMQASLKMGRLKKSPDESGQEKTFSNDTVMTALHAGKVKSSSPFEINNSFNFSQNVSSPKTAHTISTLVDSTSLTATGEDSLADKTLEGDVVLPGSFDVAFAPFPSKETTSLPPTAKVLETEQEEVVDLPYSMNIEPIFYAAQDSFDKKNVFKKLKIKEMTSEQIISSWKKMKNIKS